MDYRRGSVPDSSAKLALINPFEDALLANSGRLESPTDAYFDGERVNETDEIRTARTDMTYVRSGDRCSLG